MRHTNQQKVWDEIAPFWNKYKTESFGRKTGIVDEFIEENDERVLDLGCGIRNGISPVAEDFKRRACCYGINHPNTHGDVGTIVEVGCGSGLFTLELAEQTSSNRIMGLDLSKDMIALAESNLLERSKEKTENWIS